MEQISNETFIWLTSLASSDPHGILPVIYCGLALSSLIVNLFKNYVRSKYYFILSIHP